MQLYEKQPNGRYKPYTPAPIVMPEIETAQVVTLLSTLTMAMLISVEEQLPKHATLARRVRECQTAIKNLAQLNGTHLDTELVEIGVSAWNGAIHAMQKGLSGGVCA